MFANLCWSNLTSWINTYGFLIWYRVGFGLISLKWSLFSMRPVSRPVCVGEMVIFVRNATDILNWPILELKSPITCSLNPSPSMEIIFKEKINKYLIKFIIKRNWIIWIVSALYSHIRLCVWGACVELVLAHGSSLLQYNRKTLRKM